MTVISVRDLIVVAPSGSGRNYSFAPLSFRERAAMKAALVREAGPPVFREQLIAGRRQALRELAPDNLAELTAVLDEAEAAPGATLDDGVAAMVATIDSAAMAVPTYADLVSRNYRTVYVTPWVAAAHGLRGWEGQGLPAFRRERGLVPEELLDQVPTAELEEVGWAIWNAAHVTPAQEKNSAALSPSPETPVPTTAS